jgi:hypothetical protein
MIEAREYISVINLGDHMPAIVFPHVTWKGASEI